MACYMVECLELSQSILKLLGRGLHLGEFGIVKLMGRINVRWQIPEEDKLLLESCYLGLLCGKLFGTCCQALVPQLQIVTA